MADWGAIAISPPYCAIAVYDCEPERTHALANSQFNFQRRLEPKDPAKEWESHSKILTRANSYRIADSALVTDDAQRVQITYEASRGLDGRMLGGREMVCLSYGTADIDTRKHGL